MTYSFNEKTQRIPLLFFICHTKTKFRNGISSSISEKLVQDVALVLGVVAAPVRCIAAVGVVLVRRSRRRHPSLLRHRPYLDGCRAFSFHRREYPLRIFDAIFVGVFTGTQRTFDIHLRSFFQVLASDLCQLTKESYTMPFGRFFLSPVCLSFQVSVVATAIVVIASPLGM